MIQASRDAHFSRRPDIDPDDGRCFLGRHASEVTHLYGVRRVRMLRAQLVEGDIRDHTCAIGVNGVVYCWGAVGGGVNALVPALVDCDAGDEVLMSLTLQQGAASGRTQEAARCRNRLVRVPMHVAADGRVPLDAGPATVHPEAIIRRGSETVDDTHRTREVTLSPEIH